MTKEPLPQQIVAELIASQTMAFGILAAALGRHVPPDQLKADIAAIHKDLIGSGAPIPGALNTFVDGMTNALTLPPPGRH